MKALLVVDVQNDFCPGGKLAVTRGHEVIPVVMKLANQFDNVILTQDWHPAGHVSFASSHAGKSPFDTIELDYGVQILWPDHCVQGTAGAEFHPDLSVEKATLILRKGFHSRIDSYSAFCENDRKSSTGLRGYLRERCIRSLYIAGLATDYCVHWSAVDGRNAGFDVYVVDDACRGIDTMGSMEEARTQMIKAGVRFVDSPSLD